jgi:hypothetical protein
MHSPIYLHSTRKMHSPTNTYTVLEKCTHLPTYTALEKCTHLSTYTVLEKCTHLPTYTARSTRKMHSPTYLHSSIKMHLSTLHSAHQRTKLQEHIKILTSILSLSLQRLKNTIKNKKLFSWYISRLLVYPQNALLRNGLLLNKYPFKIRPVYKSSFLLHVLFTRRPFT